MDLKAKKRNSLAISFFVSPSFFLGSSCISGFKVRQECTLTPVLAFAGISLVLSVVYRQRFILEEYIKRSGQKAFKTKSN